MSADPRPFDSLYTHGFARVAVCVPRVRVADPGANAERTLALVEVTYGPDHPESLVWVRELEVLHRFSGQAAQALPYARRSYDLSRRLLGETHRDTLIGLGNVASNLYALGRSAEAEPIDRRVLALRTGSEWLTPGEITFFSTRAPAAECWATSVPGWATLGP